MRHFLVKKHWGELFDCIKRLLVFRGDNLLRLVMVMMAFYHGIFFAGQNRCKVMVFCYQNCSDLLEEKNVLVMEKNFFNSMLKAENLQKFQNMY